MQPDDKQGFIRVTNRLADLGLTQEILREAIEQGEIARASCTANDPPCVPGIYSWGSTVRSLRDILIPQPHGWSKTDDGNYSTVVSPDESFQIAVVTGDLGTGLANHNPTSKYPKGPKTQDAVKANRQLLLFPEAQKAADEEAARQEAADKRITWILLKRRSGDLVFAELSLPKQISKGGLIEKWQERIILDPVKVEPIAILDDAEDEAIEVVVKRRK